MKHQIPELDGPGLRKFAITTAIAFIVIFGLLIPWLFTLTFPRWPWIVAAVLVSWGIAAPSTIRPAYQLWMRLSLVIGSITTPIVLGIIYYLVILPTALIMRLFGKDPMRRQFEKDAGSYKITSEQPDRKNLERPF